jgi:hypothetical protein
VGAGNDRWALAQQGMSAGKDAMWTMGQASAAVGSAAGPLDGEARLDITERENRLPDFGAAAPA